MEIGGLRGLTFDTGQDKLIQDLQYQDQMMQRKRAMDAANMDRLIGDIEFLKGSNQYDAEKLKQEGLGLIQDIGKMTAERGAGWQTDPMFRGMLQYKKSQLPNSPAAIRSTAYQNALSSYQKWAEIAKKNPSRYNLDQLEAEKLKFANYGKDANGNPVPEEQMMPIQFNAPEEIPDFEQIHRQNGSSMEMDAFDPLKNGRENAYHAHTSETALTKKAQELYQQFTSGYNYAYKGSSPEKIVETIKNSLRPHTPHEYKTGERNPVNDALAIERGKAKIKEAFSSDGVVNGSLYDKAFFNTDGSDFGGEILESVFTARPPARYLDPNGNYVPIDDGDFNYNGDFVDVGFSLGKGRNGIKRMSGYYLKPLDWAKEKGFIHDPTGPSGDVSETDYEVKKNLRDRGEITIIETKSGKSVPMFKLNAVAEVDGRNPIYKNRVDKGMTAKMRQYAGLNPSQSESQSTQQKYSGTAQQFRDSGWTDAQIQEGIDKGLIEVK